jgi:hypothetical protein
MKAKGLKILILAVAIIICLSVALYAAYSYSQPKVTDSTSVTAVDKGGSTFMKATKVTDPDIRRID